MEERVITLIRWFAQVTYLADDPLSNNGNDTQTPFTTDAGYFTNMVWVFFILILIIGAIVILIKYLGEKNKGWLLNRSVKTLGGVPLGQNKSLQLVEIGSSIYILGVGEEVSLIQKVDDPEEIELIIGSLPSSSTFNGNSLVPILSGWIGKLRKLKPQMEEEHSEPSFQEMLYNRMQQRPNRKKMVEDMMQEEKTNERSKDQ